MHRYTGKELYMNYVHNLFIKKKNQQLYISDKTNSVVYTKPITQKRKGLGLSYGFTNSGRILF